MAILGREKALLQAHYDFFSFDISDGALYCYGEFKPTDYSITYKYRVKYNPLKSPSVTVRYPVITYHDDIHMYPKDDSLCLYHKSDLVWNDSHHLYNTIIPWTHEWFVYYELYQITGKWEHPFVPHTGSKTE
jgi:hypothetical protein